MSGIDQLKEVDRGDLIPSDQWNIMVRLLRRRVTGDGVIETSGGWHIRPGGAPGGQTVVLVRDPESTHKTLHVRKIKYADDADPVAGEFAWAGDSFKAVPEFGFEVIRYGQYYWQAPERPAGVEPDAYWDPAPDNEAKFLQARFADGHWVINHPPDIGLKWGVVQDVMDGDSHVIIMREVVETPGVVGGYEFTGEASEVRCLPGFRSRHYAGFVAAGGSGISPETQILPVFQKGSGWYAYPVYRFVTKELPPGIRFSDCTPVPEPE